LDQGTQERADTSIASAALAVSPPVADFGTVAVGFSSPVPTVITVTNMGGPTSLSPTAAGPFDVVSTTCETLMAGGTCTISMSFTPVAVGPTSGVLTLASGVTAILTGTGIAIHPPIIPDKVDLGTVTVGTTVPSSITVTAPNAVIGLVCAVSGADLVADPTESCPQTLTAGTSCIFGFNFKATTVGAKSDSVVCSAGGAFVSITVVTADVVAAAKLVFTAPTTLYVHGVVGQASSPVSFTLVNAGGSVTGLLTVIPSGDVDQFVIDNQCVLPLAAYSFCKIAAVFKPTSVGAKVLTLTVTDANAPATSAVATINGSNGSGSGSMTITGTSDFGTVAVGESSPVGVFTISNPGATDTDKLTIVVTDAQFVVTADGCSGLVLAAGRSCTISMVFKPSVAGVASATLSASAPGTATTTMSVKGIALSPPSPHPG
jgi:hypothetical protein